jgi:hypothetical protein
MGFRKLVPPAQVSFHHVQTCDQCGCDLQRYADGYEDDFYPRVFVRAEGGPDHDDARHSGELCSVACAHAWLDAQVAEYCPGWVSPRGGAGK